MRSRASNSCGDLITHTRTDTLDWQTSAAQRPQESPMSIVIDFTTAPVVEAPAKTRRNPAPLNQTPAVQHATVNRKPALRVALSGRHGEGRWMLIDPDAWAEVSAAYGAAWCLGGNGAGQLYVRAARAALRAAVRHPSGSRTTQLARLIMRAERGESVIYSNGDQLDLRRTNLVKLSQEEAVIWRREQIVRVGKREAA
jgi:hypothetical protein